MTTNRLIYLPLGGAGEVGMNAYVYGWGPEGRERLILVDCGVTFPDMDTSPGVDLILPDLTWLADRADRIEGIFITHGHEDHIGALGHLWSRLRAPVFARRFTGALAKLKLDDAGHDPEAVRIVGPRPAWAEAGPFRVQFVPTSHSIPEASALLIETPGGRVLHTGDFKLDPTPGVGEPFDEAVWAEIGRQGVKVLACDSTNVFQTHPGRSEAAIVGNLTALIGGAKGLIAATTFASNVARVKTLAEAGRAAGRSVCLLGRAMRKMVQVATETGVLTGFPPTVSPEDALSIPRDHLMLIVTGTQGERRAASAQLSRGKYLGLQMKEGDTFLFSSKTIPGNERGVLRVVNAYSEMGVDVVDDSGGLYHVSGHANRPDLERIHDLIRPQILIPLHGEHRHLREHAKLAEGRGIAAEIATNGMLLDLSGNRPEVAEYIEAGRVYLDGTALVGALDGVVRDRIRLALNGHVMVTLILDEEHLPLGEPWAELFGLPEAGRKGRPLAEAIEAELSDFLDTAPAKLLRDDEKLDDAVRRVVRQIAVEEIGKKPEVTVVVSRLSAG
ncbi:MAG: ribonuclease J [Gemmobacter sp.]